MPVCFVEGRPNLRWIERDGERVLQQLFEHKKMKNGILVGVGHEWRDVPVAKEENEH